MVARDDYGVAKVELASKAEMLDADKQVQTSTASAPLFGPATKPLSETDVQNRHDFVVATLKLPAGALLSLNATATDDCYGGAQTGASRPVTFRIVAPEELFREILLRQQGAGRR